MDPGVAVQILPKLKFNFNKKFPGGFLIAGFSGISPFPGLASIDPVHPEE